MNPRRPLIEKINKPCRKQGHKSQGAAEAHLRGLLKAQEFKPDVNDGIQMTVYYCISKHCRARPWHVGHDRYARVSA